MHQRSGDPSPEELSDAPPERQVEVQPLAKALAPQPLVKANPDTAGVAIDLERVGAVQDGRDGFGPGSGHLLGRRGIGADGEGERVGEQGGNQRCSHAPSLAATPCAL